MKFQSLIIFHHFLGNYILTPDFISTYKKIDLTEASILWDIIHDPINTTVSDVKAIVFDRRFSDKQRRYYLQSGPRASSSVSTSSESPPATADNTHYQDDMNELRNDHDEPVVDFEVDTIVRAASPSPSTSSTSFSRVQSMINTCRSGNQSRNKERQPAVYFEEDFVSLPPLDSYSDECPLQLDDMLKIVRDVRDVQNTTRANDFQRIVVSQSTTPQQHNQQTTNALGTRRSSSSPLTVFEKKRTNNYTVMCEKL